MPFLIVADAVTPVTPAIPDLPGRYATPTDLTSWLGRAAPAGAGRLLNRAADLIDSALLTACYPVDELGLPTSSSDTAALRDATCAQVEMWLTSDEEDDILGPVQNVGVGSLQVAFGAGANRAAPTYLAPRAWRALQGAGLTGHAPTTRGAV